MSAPYGQGVTTDYPATSRVDRGLIRDVIAVTLVLVAVVGLSVAGFATDWRLGLAVVSLAAGGAGVFLGYER